MMATNKHSEAVKLLTAAKFGDFYGVRAALRAGSDIEAKDPGKYNYTSLHWSAHRSHKDPWNTGHEEVARLLIRKRAIIDPVNNVGETPLMVASQRGNNKLVSLFLANGANINYTCEKGITSLMLASQKGHFKVVEILLSNGAQTDLKDYKGGTALIFASHKGHDKVVDILLTNKFQVDLKNVVEPPTLS